jgi:hypothetical protein
MAYSTKGFFMPSNNAEDEEFARLYTLSTYEIGKKDINFRVLFHYSTEENKWIYRKYDGTDIYLNGDEVMRLIGCNTCAKIKMNNWTRYCSPECPYYFNTPTLKKIIRGF